MLQRWILFFGVVRVRVSGGWLGENFGGAIWGWLGGVWVDVTIIARGCDEHSGRGVISVARGCDEYG